MQRHCIGTKYLTEKKGREKRQTVENKGVICMKHDYTVTSIFHKPKYEKTLLQ